MALILVNDFDAFGRPAQFDGHVNEGVLTRRRFLVVENLMRGRLPNVYERQALMVVRLQFGGTPSRCIR